MEIEPHAVHLTPHFIANLDDEVRAFIHMSGIIMRENAHGGVMPTMRHGSLEYVLYLHRGNFRTIEYWREIALRGYAYLQV